MHDGYDMSIFKACDIRAPYGEQLQDRHAILLGQALALMMGPTEVVVGGDARLSTPRLKGLLIESLVAAGCRVVDLGTVPTPAFYFARARLGIATAVMVTASHNPPNHNGFKLTLGELPISEAEIDRLRELMERGASAAAMPGQRSEYDILPAYLDFVGALVPDRSALRVVIDYGNGVGALAGPQLWPDRAEAVALFDSVDGRFPERSPDPAVARNLTALREAVPGRGADLGVAYDGDADRVALVDERGEVVANDKVIALFARDLLRRGPAPVVYDQKCSRVVPQTVEAAGGEAVMEKSGHTFIKTTFLERGAIYAGELSGHHFFRMLPQGDDGIFASLWFARLLADGGRPLSALVADLPDYPITADIRLPVAPDEAERILAELRNGLAGEARLSQLDGVRAEFDDGWGLARRSVTEPLVTLRFEGDDRTALKRIMTRFASVAPELAGRLPEAG